MRVSILNSDASNGVIYSIYSAALEPSKWDAAVSDLADYLGATSGFYGGLDMRSGRGAYWYAHGLDLDIQRLYNEKYVACDPTLRSIMQTPGVAQVFDPDKCSDHPDFEAFFQEFMFPTGLGSVLSAITNKRGSLFSLFGFQRKTGLPSFSTSEQAKLQALIPHLEQADRIASRLAVMDESRYLLMGAMDRIDHGIVFLNGSGQIRLTNRKAESLLESGQFMMAELGRLLLSRANDNIQFHGKLAEIATGSAPAAYMNVQCARGISKANIAILPLNAAEESLADGSDIRAVVYVTTSAAPQTNVTQFLIEGFGLTVAEVRVLTALAKGERLEQIGTSLSISLSTVKTHIQHLFQKTGVNRQTDLVRIYYGLPAIL
jgi:DNA-binding CsgD family transcriptional regulator